MSNVNDITSIALIIAGIVVVAIVGIGFCFAISKGYNSKATVTDGNKKIEVHATNSNLDE
jgi:uncharacterized membrane protein YqiK